MIKNIQVKYKIKIKKKINRIKNNLKKNALIYNKKNILKNINEKIQ
jgi:hypothetical protein